MKGVEERSGELVVTGRDGVVDLEMTDHAPAAVALAVKALVPAERGFAIGARRDDGSDAVLALTVADGVVVVGLQYGAAARSVPSWRTADRPRPRPETDRPLDERSHLDT